MAIATLPNSGVFPRKQMLKTVFVMQDNAPPPCQTCGGKTSFVLMIPPTYATAGANLYFCDDCDRHTWVDFGTIITTSSGQKIATVGSAPVPLRRRMRRSNNHRPVVLYRPQGVH